MISHRNKKKSHSNTNEIEMKRERYKNSVLFIFNHERREKVLHHSLFIERNSFIIPG